MSLTPLDIVAAIAAFIFAAAVAGVMLISLLPSPVTRDLYKRFAKRRDTGKRKIN